MRLFPRLRRTIAPSLLIFLGNFPAQTQQISDSAMRQIRDITAVKHSLRPHQRKIASNLMFAVLKTRGQLRSSLSTDALTSVSQDADGSVLVDIKVDSVETALGAIGRASGREIYSSAHDGMIRARVPLQSLETVAQSGAVRLIRPAALARTSRVTASTNSFLSPTAPLWPADDRKRSLESAPSRSPLPLLASNGVYPAVHLALHSLAGSLHLAPFIGSLTSQGYISHAANKALALGVDGTGVRVGVLSDSASAAEVSALVASGDLPPDTLVLPGQDGTPGSDEGTAMMEIVHDLAPGAQLFFATAFTSESSFADNIRALRFTYGCDIIVDDVSYSDEPPFQDGIVAQAVNDVTADGALYFSAATNSGNLTYGTSGTWEGDFSDGGDAGRAIDLLEGSPVRIHNFGSATSAVTYDRVTAWAPYLTLYWSDALGKSANDYDLFLLNSSGSAVIAASIFPQTGREDPIESIVLSSGIPAGTRVVVVKQSGEARGLHLSTGGSELAISTTGATIGHNAAQNTITMAASAWNSAHQGTRPFTGFANHTEIFSSDGPRTIFYNPDGTPITAGNFLFATGGGQSLLKPDLTAADGVTTRTPGFNPFYGTSAAGPHAAAIAALIKSANPSLTSSQIKDIMVSTALDTMTPGPDRDAGYGIVMALPAVQAALSQ